MEAATEADLAVGVRAIVAEHEPDPGELTLTTIPGGASRETWLADAGGRRWVVRRDPLDSQSLVPIGEEFELLRLVADAGVPVPAPIAYEPTDGRLGTPGMLVAFVGGTSVGPRILRKDDFIEARGRLPTQLAAALARIHSLTTADVAGVLPSLEGDPAVAQLDEWESQLDAIGEPFPAIELGLRWLRANAPEPASPRLVHGDFRLGNFILDESGLAAVIDWELAHVGDPAEDIGWLCIRSWRFGNDALPVAGLGKLESFLQAYEEAGGTRPGRDRLHYWEAFGNLKWAVICARQAQDHLTGARRSHELASLGRRVCEPEWDLLQLVGDAGS